MSDWTTLGRLEDLPEGRGSRHQVGDQQVLVVRVGERVFALGNRCSHQGAPLDRGAVRALAPMSVTCPAHGSMFALEDGRVMRGPATKALPRFDVAIEDGSVSVRPAEGP